MKAAGVEKKLSKISGLADKTANKFSKVQKRISGFASRIKKNVQSAASEIPLLGRAFDLVTNPIVLGTAIIAGAIALMGNATVVAKEFNHEFLNIKQLNLDKNVEQMANYKEQIRDASFELGTNLIDSTKAFYDLQSGTGLYGDAAVAVFKKVGKYSVATGANINDSVNSTVKAMRAFNLEISDIDKLLLSNAKTVQMGITTFDELAKVQTEFAGAASSANQSIDTSNKLFAVFTSIAKNSDVGANMTKTAFQGLKEQAENISKYTGIKVFDNGEMRQADKILIDIARKFKTLNDEEISKIITNIGGPEGLRELLGKVQTGADDLIKTFEGFDGSSFNLETALKNAQGDVTILTDIVKNRFQIVMSKLGEKVLPLVAEVLDKINNVLEWAYNNWEDIGLAIKVTTGIIAAYTVAQWALNIALTANPIGVVVMALALWVGWIIYATSKTKGFRNTIEGVSMIATEFWNQIKLSVGFVANEVAFKIDIMKLRFTQLGQHLKGVVENIKNAWQKIKKLDFTGAKDALTADIKTDAEGEIERRKNTHDLDRESSKYKMRESFGKSFTGIQKINTDQIRLLGTFTGDGPDLDPLKMTDKVTSGLEGTFGNTKNKDSIISNVEDKFGNTKNKNPNTENVFGKTKKGTDPFEKKDVDPTKIPEGIKAINGGGKSVRNVRVTIGKLVEQIVVQTENIEEGASEIRDIIQEELIKAMQGYEIAAG